MSKQSSERKASKSAQVVGRSLDRVVGRDELVEELAGLIWEVQTRTCCKPHHFADIEEKNKRFWKKADALGYDRASLVESARTILSEPIPTPNPEGLRTRHLVAGTQHPLVVAPNLAEKKIEKGC